MCELYVKISSPVSIALDILQGEKSEKQKYHKLFMGTLIPEILRAVELLKVLKIPSASLPSLKALKKGVETRFKYAIDLALSETKIRELCLASMSHPFFKTRWIPPGKEDELKELLLAKARKMNRSNLATSPKIDGDIFGTTQCIRFL